MEHFYPQADDKMRRSGSKSTSDTTSLNHVPLPNITSSPPPQAPTQLHSTSTARDPRETALSAALSWSLFKKTVWLELGAQPKPRTELCLSPGVEGTWSHHKDIQASSRGKAKRKKKTFYRILSPVFMNTGGTTEKSTSLNSFPQHHVTQDITNLLAIED